MIRIKFIISFLISIFLLTFWAKAQNEVQYDTVEVQAPAVEPTSEYEESYNDSEAFNIDTVLLFNTFPFSVDSNNALKKDKQFAYVKNLDSLLIALQKKEKPKEEEVLPPHNERNFLETLLSSRVTEIFLWVLAVLFILFIVYRLFFAEGFFLQRSVKSRVNLQSGEEVAATDLNFDQLITQSLGDNNYRLAVRYLYLQTLHILAEKELIAYAEDKTNYQYVRELQSKTQLNGFASLTLNYEFIWYGEFNIDGEAYSKLQTEFKNFQALL